MIAASFILLLCLLFADLGSARYKQQAALDYQKEHSLFENILFTGEAYPGAFQNLDERNVSNNMDGISGINSIETISRTVLEEGEIAEEKEQTPEKERAAEKGQTEEKEKTTKTAEEKRGEEEAEKDELQNGTVQIPEARQQIRLIKRREGKWSLYLPADLAGRVRVKFDHFAVLELNSLQEKTGTVQAESLEKSSALRSGDIFHCSGVENGSLWRARLLDKDGAVLEEAELVCIHSQW